MKPYLNIPVETARAIACEFDKQIVIICTWNHQHSRLHTVMYGSEPADKISEDFRTVNAARNAQLRDLAPGLIHVLRSYQFGNAATEPAKDFADKLEALMSP